MYEPQTMAVSLPLFSTTSGSAIPSPLLPFSPRCISPRLVLASCSFQPRTTLLSMSLQREGDNAGMDGVAGEDDGHGITYFASSQQPALGSQHWTADEQQATIREPDEVPDRRRRHLLGMVDDRNSNMEESHRSRNPRVSPRLLSRSIGSRSIPSQSSVPGKYSKYSHPATTSKPLKASTSGKLSNDSVSSTFSFPSTLEPVDCVFPDAEEASAASPMDLRSSLLSQKSLHDGNSVRSGSSLSSKAVPSTNTDAVPRAGSRSLTWLQQPGHDVSSRKNDLFLPDEALSSDSMFAASGVDSRYSSWSQQSANNANSEDKSSFLSENISSPSHTLNAASPAYSRSSPFSRKSVNTRNSVRKGSFLPQSTFPSDSIVASQTMSPSWSEHSVDDVDSEEVFSSDSDNTDFQAYSRPSTLPQKPACDVNLVRRGTFPFKRKKGLNFKRKIIGSTNASIATENPRQTLSDLPFDPQYSYSETPKVAPIGYREPQYSPFGPLTMGRPWTGRAPLKPSKKKLPEFDSFNPPRAGKKGVKYVQQPGPFPMNQGPKEVKSREEILGEPLSKEEIQELVESCMREKRQTNLGRDGLIHNMLDLIHTHWKRRRVCRVRCLGVPTVDMDNVCFHLEDKTGGKVIHRAGGVVYLFRGRYYNYRNRPRIPIMLWKPAAPVYPKLIQPSPGGLTMEAANALRKIGRKVVPLCKLGKNGVYVNLVNDVRDAFRIDELVRVDCTGLNPSDYKKIGAKLQELVPCVLLSFEKEHILMWRGKSNTKVDDFNENADTTQNKAVPSVEETSSLKAENVSLEQNEKNLVTDGVSDFGELNPSLVGDELMEQGDERSVESMTFLGSGQNNSPLIEVALSEQSSEPETFSCSSGVTSLPFEDVLAEQCDKPMHLSEYSGISSPIIKDGPAQQTNESYVPSIFNPESERIQIESHGQSLHTSETDQKNGDFIEKNELVDNFKNLDFSWRLAIESGTAIVLDDADSDADLVLQKTIEFAKVAPYAPPYRHSLLHILSYKKKNTEHISVERKARKRQTMRRPKKNPTQITGPPLEVPPFGGLGVDELAKLLAP